MRITLSPQRRDDSLKLERHGEALIFNGVAYDFSVLNPGDTLMPEGHDCEWIVGPVECDAQGTLHLTVLLPNGPEANEAQRFPAPIINPANGKVKLP